MRRTGLGRHGDPLADDAGDPLDGLVNLFDIGLVLAVAFLVAGLGLTVDARTKRIERRPDPQRSASGRGTPLGALYRLDDGRLVVVEPGGERRVLP